MKTLNFIAFLFVFFFNLNFVACGTDNQTPGVYIPVQDVGGTDAQEVETSVPECTTDAKCDDGIWCNGTEACVAGKCVTNNWNCGNPKSRNPNFCDEQRKMCASCMASTASVDCDDGTGSTIESCENGRCQYTTGADWCIIAGNSYPAGEERFDNHCLICSPSTSNKDWSSNPACARGEDISPDVTDTSSPPPDAPDVFQTPDGDAADTTPDTNVVDANETSSDSADTPDVTVGEDTADVGISPDTNTTPDVVGKKCSTSLECEDGNTCTLNGCVNGTCADFAQPEGTNCNDGNPCTVDDSCTKDVKCVGTPIVCDDGDACTNDSCKNASCLFTAKNCADGFVCTVDSCDKGVCKNTPISCDDGLPCTNDSCDNAGKCQHSESVAFCDDGNPCTVGDHCQSNICVSGAPKSCDDGNPCTNDSCDGAGVCQHSLVSCEDKNVCTADACDPGSGGCIHQVWVKNPPENDCGYGNIDADKWQDLGGDIDADNDGVCDNATDLKSHQDHPSWYLQGSEQGLGPQSCSGVDNCWWVSNPSQLDSDGDGIGDACDPTP